MSIYVAPSTQFEATAQSFPTGITGTIGVRIVDNTGATVTARTTAGIVEHPAGSGIYAATLTSPSVAGQYAVVWDTGGSDVSWAVEDLVVTPTSIPVYGAAPLIGARAGMVNLIQQVRGLTAAGTAEYTVGTVSYWTDGQVEEVLDRHRQDLVRHKLMREPSYIGGGSVVYTRHRSAYGQLEKPTSGSTVFFIEDSVGDDRGTATYTADYQLGIFDFASDVGGTALYLTARSYDIYGAAGEILEEWASNEARSFDFGTDGQSFSRSQKAQGLREQARAMRKKARIRRKNLRTES